MRLQVDDVCAGARVRDRATVIQKKTGRPVQFEITEQTRASIQDWLAKVGARKGQYLFPSRFRAQPHLSTCQYARTFHGWVESAGLESSAYGTHSMRGRRRRRSTRRRATCEPSSCSSGIRSSKAPSAISASRSMTRSAFPSRSSCELITRFEGAVSCAYLNHAPRQFRRKHNRHFCISGIRLRYRLATRSNPNGRRAMTPGFWFWAAGLGVALAAAAPAKADEAPKYGGTLTYMIPADSPPSFDAQREETYATIHSAAPFYSVLITDQPLQSGIDHRHRLRSVHRDAEADRWRQDLHLQDPRRRQVP